MKRILLCLLLLLSFVPRSFGERDYITLLATTSVENSGFLDYILPIFEQLHGIPVRAVISGSGAAIVSAKRGNGDVLITHSPMDEAEFIAGGWGVERLPFMYNEFVIIGEGSDAAGIGEAESVGEAFLRIAEGRHVFVSRSDGSGTDRREKLIWREIGLSPWERRGERRRERRGEKGGEGGWYVESGGGMGSAFAVAVAKGGYIFGDTSTWARFGRKGGHEILFRDSDALRNQYVLMAVNPGRHDHVKYEEVKVFIDWLLSAEGQGAIDDYRINGTKVFIGNAGEHAG